MRVVECPEELNKTVPYSIFLAGGITGTPEWQKEMIQRFARFGDNLVLFNPRRKSFDVEDKMATIPQIRWEHRYLNKADAILFWFPYHTLCPITLFELGKWSMTGKPIFVGCHSAYQKKLDVEQQLSYINSGIKVRDNFTDLVQDVEYWLRDEGCYVQEKA